MKSENKITKLSITKSAAGGYGIGRNYGKVIFVPCTVPGDIIDAEITEDKKNHSFAEIVQVLSGAPDRIVPACPAFGTCGGCSYLNVRYERELEIKKAVAVDVLGRIAGLRNTDCPEIEVISADRFQYRSHASIKLMDGVPGFFQRGSHEHVPFPERGCRLCAEGINTGLQKGYNSRGPGEIRTAIDSEGALFDSAMGSPVIREREQDIIFDRDIGRFFQVNRFLRTRMLSAVHGLISLSNRDSFLDIGCGVGFFSLYLAKYFARGTGIDIDKRSIQWAKHNAKINSVKNVSFEHISIAEMNPARYSPGLVILDPPRAGLSKKGRHNLFALKAQEIIYVSCNPATFARDAQDIIRAGYTLDRIILIDMFPGTHHIELISQFRLSE